MAQQLLSRIKVEEISPGPESMVVVDSRDSIAQTLLTLVKQNIFCAPVMDHSANRFTGLVDMIDIVCFVVDIAKNTEQLGLDYFAFLEREEQFKQRCASDVADLSHRNKLCPVPRGSSLLDAVTVMATNHIQRVPITDNSSENFKIVGLLSQTAVIDFLARHVDRLGPSVHKTLKELGFGPKPVISIDHSKRAIDAFRLMAEHRVSGLPVLDGEKRLLTNISARDMRAITSDARLFQRLYVTVGEFVSQLRAENLYTMHPGICCTFDDKFDKVIMKLAAARIHRIYVVDEHKHPVGVISLHDVLSKILELNEARAGSAHI